MVQKAKRFNEKFLQKHIMKNSLKIGIAIIMFALQSCGAKKIVLQDKLPKVDDDELFAALDSISGSTPAFLSSRIDTKYSDNKQNQSFKISLKIDKANAIHTLMTFAGIPMITAKVTQDSVNISNKKDRCYITESLSYFKQQFGIDFSYKNMEELLLGRPLNYQSDQKYYHINDPYNYIVATQKKLEDNGKLLIAYHLSPDLKHLKKVEINSFEDQVTIVINYPEYHIDTLFSSPKIIETEITTQKNKINLLLSYDKVEINVPKEMIIVIPESYARCK